MDDAEVREHVAALGTMLDELPADAAPAVEALLRLFGETLRRIVTLSRDAPEITAEIARDELIAHMLALHEVPLERAVAPDRPERCDLCSEALAEAHPHLLDSAEKRVLCVCAVCALLFPQRADTSGRYRFVPETIVPLENLAFDALTWRALEIPVAIAYFVRSATDRVTAYYPSPAGAVESLLDLDAWKTIVDQNPALRDLAVETQALLVNGTGTATEGWIVGVDTCYRLISVMRAHWRGLRGGDAVARELEHFFGELRSNSTSHRRGEGHAITGTV
jgi:hypothetical protein